MTQTQAILGPRFVGMYLYGSLALGDFDPQTSDIDAMVVTEGALAHAHVVALEVLHTRFSASASPWAGRLEAAYIPQDVLRQRAPTTGRYPQIEKGGTLALEPLESGWMVQCHTLRAHGLIVAGPPLTALIPPISRHQLDACAAYAEVWWDQARHGPEWLDWLGRRDHDAFVVLTLCRMLYTLDAGDVASKPAAARWAQRALGPRWAPLIAGALSAQHDHGSTPQGDIHATVALVAYTVEQYHRRPRP